MFFYGDASMRGQAGISTAEIFGREPIWEEGMDRDFEVRDAFIIGHLWSPFVGRTSGCWISSENADQR
jgi:hypothetical protein